MFYSSVRLSLFGVLHHYDFNLHDCLFGFRKFVSADNFCKSYLPGVWPVVTLHPKFLTLLGAYFTHTPNA